MTPHLNESVVKTYPKKLQKWHMEMVPFFFSSKKEMWLVPPLSLHLSGMKMGRSSSGTDGVRRRSPKTGMLLACLAQGLRV